ncbi:MAG: SCO family protein, partial [Myxococcota bacterium]|nr:SCO family protein [Myxococcota bacterium]
LETARSAAPSVKSRRVRSALIGGAAALAIGLALVARSLRPTHAMPVYGHLPAFQLVDERGAPFAPESMLGHVNVVDFIFTRCTSSCPRLTSRMTEVQSRLALRAPDVHFVSFSVDPENDTPSVLAAYADKAHADPARWRFVTGPLDAIERAVVLGFKVAAAKIAKGADDYEVTHGEWFVLVDRSGDIRGYYPIDEPSDVDALVGDVMRLDKR